MRTSFPIPMRGNEASAHPRRTAGDTTFPIPMRGNEEQFFGNDLYQSEFPIPMRGNETDYGVAVMDSYARSRSP